MVVGGTGGKGGFSSCFEAGSLVATPHGSVPIETLGAGDEVLAFDERTGVVVPRRILRTWIHETTRTGTLALRDGRVLRVTPEHPVFVAATQRFERADAIGRGDELVTLPFTLAGSAPTPSAMPASVLASSNGYSLRELDSPVTVYNLSIEDLETYFVDGVLVHNKTGGTSYAGQNFGGKGGSGGGAGQCEPEHSDSIVEDCIAHDLCLDPARPVPDFVPLNRPVASVGEGGAGGEGPFADAGAAGVPGDDDESLGFTSIEVGYCSQDYDRSGDAHYYLAYDAYQPDGQTPTHEIAQSFGGCLAAGFGIVVLSDRSVPPRGSWTTQCVRLTGQDLYDGLQLRILESDARLDNPRFVTGCECPRHLKRYTTCGIDPGGLGGGSACEQEL
jgi:hypothetical protein